MQKSFSFNDFRSPFLDEVQDDGKLSMTYDRFPIIPFQGTNSSSADGVLNSLHRLSEITPIYAGILQSMGQFVFGAGLKAVKTSNNIFEDNVEMSRGESLQFGELLKDKLYKCDLNNVLNSMFNGLLIDGNIGLKVRVSSTGKATIKFVSQKFFRYLKEEVTGMQKAVLISPTFVYDYVLSKDPYSVPLYPNFRELENGAKETFFHFKETRIDRELYGLSYTASSLMNQYLMNQLLSYLSSETDNRFTGQVLFEVPVFAGGEDEKSEEGIGLVKTLRKVFKAKGNGESIAIHFREEGLDELKTHEFKANTNENFYKTIREIVNEEILTSTSWDKRLIGISKENGLGGNDMEAIFKTASMKVLKIQRFLSRCINTVFVALSELENFKEFEGKGIELKSLYESLKESENKYSNGIDNTNGDNKLN